MILQTSNPLTAGALVWGHREGHEAMFMALADSEPHYPDSGEVVYRTACQPFTAEPSKGE